MLRRTLSLVGCSALLVCAMPVKAQSPVPAPEAAATAEASANWFAVTPTSALLSVPIEIAPEQPSVRSVDAIGKAMFARPARTEGATLMIVGGAGILTGILIDEGLISFIGAGVGLYGLYLYLR